MSARGASMLSSRAERSAARHLLFAHTTHIPDACTIAHRTTALSRPRSGRNHFEPSAKRWEDGALYSFPEPRRGDTLQIAIVLGVSSSCLFHARRAHNVGDRGTPHGSHYPINNIGHLYGTSFYRAGTETRCAAAGAGALGHPDEVRYRRHQPTARLHGRHSGPRTRRQRHRRG